MQVKLFGGLEELDEDSSVNFSSISFFFKAELRLSKISCSLETVAITSCRVLI